MAPHHHIGARVLLLARAEIGGFSKRRVKRSVQPWTAPSRRS